MEFVIVGCGIIFVLLMLIKEWINIACDKDDTELKKKGLERDEDIIC